MDPVVHFEMPAEDAARMSKFYETVFGWKTESTGPEMGNYVLAETTPTNGTGRPTVPGGINGGFYQKGEDSVTRLTISVDDIRASSQKIQAAGGRLLPGMQNPNEPDVIQGVGLYQRFIDTEGNLVTMLQPNLRG